MKSTRKPALEILGEGMDTTCQNHERCGREAGYCEACVEALLQDERARCAQVAEASPELLGRDIATLIRKLQTD